MVDCFGGKAVIEIMETVRKVYFTQEEIERKKRERTKLLWYIRCSLIFALKWWAIISAVLSVGLVFISLKAALYIPVVWLATFFPVVWVIFCAHFMITYMFF